MKKPNIRRLAALLARVRRYLLPHELKLSFIPLLSPGQASGQQVYAPVGQQALTSSVQNTQY